MREDFSKKLEQKDMKSCELSELNPESAIEKTLPFEKINKLALLESYNKHHYRPTNYQHKWWAKRLGSVFRSLTIATLNPPDTSKEELWNQYYQSPQFDQPLILDPMMGGGTTGQEVTRLNGKFIGIDINPVAWFISRMALSPQPVQLDEYFQRVISQTNKEVSHYYQTLCPQCGNKTKAQFYLWVENVEEAQNNNEKKSVRQYDSLVVDYKRGGEATVVCPKCNSIFSVDTPQQSRCSECGHFFDATKENVQVPVDSPSLVFNGEERPAYEPYAVKYDCDCGNGFKEFDEFDIERYKAASERFNEVKDELPLPTQEIPKGGEKTCDLHNRNYKKWIHLFNSRQLLTLGTLLKKIKEVDDKVARHYLTLTFSATLEFNTMFCSYKGADPQAPGAVRHIFSHHAYIHPSEPLENNPLGVKPRQSGTFRYLYEYRLKKSLNFQKNPVERNLNDDGTVKEKKTIESEQIGGSPAESLEELISEDRSHYLLCGDSKNFDVSNFKVDAVITDPPYYDSVQYAELADFFYVWLKQSLESDFPEVFAPNTVASEGEVIGSRSQKKTLDDYQRLLQDVFLTSFEALKEDGVLVFTFHHKDLEAWGAVLEALNTSGFRVVNTYPVRGENRMSVHIKNQRAIQLDSVIVCRKNHKQPSGKWDEIYESIKNKSWKRVKRFHQSEDEDLSLLDASVIVRGECMTQYSKYRQVLDTGDEISEREAMNRIEEIVVELNDRKF